MERATTIIIGADLDWLRDLRHGIGDMRLSGSIHWYGLIRLRVRMYDMDRHIWFSRERFCFTDNTHRLHPPATLQQSCRSGMARYFRRIYRVSVYRAGLFSLLWGRADDIGHFWRSMCISRRMWLDCRCTRDGLARLLEGKSGVLWILAVGFGNGYGFDVAEK